MNAETVYHSTLNIILFGMTMLGTTNLLMLILHLLTQ